MDYLGESDYAHGGAQCVGVLLANLGTPEAPTPAAVRRYLAEFLADPRVIEVPRLLWWLVLHGVVLRVRPRRSAANYARIWTDEGSPLLVIGERQRRGLQERLDQESAPGVFRVELAMRYGQPSIAAALERLREAHARRLLVLPLYPQYSATTTASTFDAVAEHLRRWRWLPALQFITEYHDDDAYLGALAASIGEAWSRDARGERLLFSFHGLPRRYLDAGDPYHCACQKTARLVASRLGLEADRWQVAFQSRVGREPWLEPYTDRLLESWARSGVRRVDVVCPGFAADCLETLEEIAMQNEEAFRHAGGERLRYIPALNDREDHLRALAALVMRRCAPWLEEPGAFFGGAGAEERGRSRERARALGAPR